MEYFIRSVKPDDIFSVIKIAYETLPERYNPTVFNHFYESFPSGFLVAEHHHKLIGFIVGIQTQPGIVKILMLAVRKKYRRQKLGSSLLEHFLKAMLQQNISRIDLEVRTNNTPAITFYQQHGFTIVDTLYKFYQNGEDAHIMRKML